MSNGEENQCIINKYPLFYHCAWCKSSMELTIVIEIKRAKMELLNTIYSTDVTMKDRESHGICPTCAKKEYPNFYNNMKPEIGGRTYLMWLKKDIEDFLNGWLEPGKQAFKSRFI